jgi:hypothetical protein
VRKTSVLREARENFHAALLKSGLLGLPGRGPQKRLPQRSSSDAEGKSATSAAVTQAIYDRIQSGSVPSVRPADQISDTKFEQITRRFIQEAFRCLDVPLLGKRGYAPGRGTVPDSERRLADLARSAEKNLGIAVLLCSGYVTAAEALMRGKPKSDQCYEAGKRSPDETAELRSGLGKRNNRHTVVLGGISYLWTMDDIRPESPLAIRNLKGTTPHTAVATGESLPSRLASLTLGNSNIDCVYHFALPELIAALKNLATDDSVILVKIMVDEKRLKDISDLPLNLAMWELMVKQVSPRTVSPRLLHRS